MLLHGKAFLPFTAILLAALGLVSVVPVVALDPMSFNLTGEKQKGTQNLMQPFGPNIP